VKNRRLYERTEIEPLELVFEQIDHGQGMYENVLVRFEEVSSYGIRFTTNVEFILNGRVDFRLPSLHAESLFSGRIAWVEKQESDQYRYGLEVILEEEKSK
jgi:hypothetical protein